MSGDDSRKTLSIENPRYHAITVADVGNRKITAQEFLFNYEFGPAFPKREPDSRHRYLDFMIYEKLLALEGYERRLDTTGQARQSLAEVEGDLATEELYKDDVRSKVSVPENEVRRGIQRANIHLTLHWLYARTKGRADTLREQLRRGTSFDSLFASDAPDSARRVERSMETTLFKLDQRNPALAAVIDTISLRSPSSPIAVPDGFYIVMVSDRWSNPLVTESESAKLSSDVERALVEHKSDSLSDEYIRRMMEGERPNIVRKPFDILQTHLAEIVLGPKKFSDWKLAGRLSHRWGDVDFHDMKRAGKQALVELSRRKMTRKMTPKMTLRDFLNWYHAREYTVRLNTASPQAFFLSVEETVWRMVRDKLLIERALRRGLQRRELVTKQMQWWKDKIVYRLVRAGISDSIRSTDAALRKYYADHRRDYRSAGGDTLSFGEARESVLADFYSAELTKRLLHRLIRLKEKFGVEIRENDLKNLAIDDEFDPRAIDVYAVKKGGTFPRPAFPSIDQEWQTWNR